MADQELKAAVEKFARDLADKAQSFVNDITELEVRTYTTPSEQPATVASSSPLDDPTTAARMKLRAYTKISFDCDTVMCVPINRDEQVDSALWEVHQTMVNQAMEHRAELLRTMGEALGAAVRALQQVEG